MSVEEHLKSLRKEQNAIKIENNIKLIEKDAEIEENKIDDEHKINLKKIDNKYIEKKAELNNYYDEKFLQLYNEKELNKIRSEQKAIYQSNYFSFS